MATPSLVPPLPGMHPTMQTGNSMLLERHDASGDVVEVELAAGMSPPATPSHSVAVAASIHQLSSLLAAAAELCKPALSPANPYATPAQQRGGLKRGRTSCDGDRRPSSAGRPQLRPRVKDEERSLENDVPLPWPLPTPPHGIVSVATTYHPRVGRSRAGGTPSGTPFEPGGDDNSTARAFADFSVARTVVNTVAAAVQRDDTAAAAADDNNKETVVVGGDGGGDDVCPSADNDDDPEAGFVDVDGSGDDAVPAAAVNDDDGKEAVVVDVDGSGGDVGARDGDGGCNKHDCPLRHALPATTKLYSATLVGVVPGTNSGQATIFAVQPDGRFKHHLAKVLHRRVSHPSREVSVRSRYVNGVLQLLEDANIVPLPTLDTLSHAGADGVSTWSHTVLLYDAWDGDLLAWWQLPRIAALRAARDTLPYEVAVIGIVRQMLRGLLAALQFGVAHADVKPENTVFRFRVDHTGAGVDDVALIDFGAGVGVSTDAATPPVVLTGYTPRYAPREVVHGEPCDPRAVDVWGVGVTTLVLLTGVKFASWAGVEAAVAGFTANPGRWLFSPAALQFVVDATVRTPRSTIPELLRSPWITRW